MCEELKNLKYQGGKEGLLSFFVDIVGNKVLRIEDAEVLCSHASGQYYLSAQDLCDFCAPFGWIIIDEGKIRLSEDVLRASSSCDTLNDFLVKDIIDQLFDNGVFSAELFSYDAVTHQFAFRNEIFPLAYSTLRNTLISQGFIVSDKSAISSKFHINPVYENVISPYCQKQRKHISLNQLKKRLEENEVAGEKAELFVMQYEQKRLGKPLGDLVKRISIIDVTAGYDIVSFKSTSSSLPDRFIEVKAVSESGFYWSSNEYEIAKLYGESYCLYLVKLQHIDDEGYTPEIIINPAHSVMETSEWLVEPQTYHIRKII